jgi:hypothetical protein
MNKTYIGQIGHDQALAKAELYFNDENNCIDQISSKFFLSQTIDSFHDKACVVYYGEVLKEYQENEKILIEEALANYPIKGRRLNIFATNFKLKNPNLKELKNKLNIKGVNFWSMEGPNYGHLSANATNLVLIKGSKKKNIYIVDASYYSNQEFYKFTDEKLPHSDLKKGIINLKLAKTMLNLTKSSNIVDPFAGFGRFAFCQNQKSLNFNLSDSDQDCKRFIEENISFIENNSKFFNPNIKISLLPFIEFEELSSKIDELIKEPFSIVTEGTLGKNFGKKVPVQAVLSEQREVFKIWSKSLKNIESQKNKPKDIIFTLPFTNFYPISKEQLEKFLTHLEKELKYYNFKTFFDKTKVIFYSRGNSFIGHGLVKLSLK